MINSRNILYLDFDGVLHHENVLWHPKKGAWLAAPSNFRLFQYMDCLEEAIKDIDLKIVLSTAWVKQYGYNRCVGKLSPELRERCIGATFHSYMDLREFESMSRGLQIWSDVTRRKPINWLAVDDDDFNWPAWCRDNLIKTHATLGVSEESVLNKLKNKLSVFTADGVNKLTM